MKKSTNDKFRDFTFTFRYKPSSPIQKQPITTSLSLSKPKQPNIQLQYSNIPPTPIYNPPSPNFYQVSYPYNPLPREFSSIQVYPNYFPQEPQAFVKDLLDYMNHTQ